MKIRWFEHTHPLVLFVYLLGVMGVCLASLHPWYVAGQFHPELKSRPNRPHPLFRDFVGAAIKHQEQV